MGHVNSTRAGADLRFIEALDLLVATAHHQSWLDIPRANTSSSIAPTCSPGTLVPIARRVGRSRARLCKTIVPPQAP